MTDLKFRPDEHQEPQGPGAGALLFKLKKLHGGPKSQAEWSEWVVVDDELQLFLKLAKRAYWEDRCWHDDYDDPHEACSACEEQEIYDADHNVIGTETRMEGIWRQAGDLDDEDAWGDAYYGVKLYGWERPGLEWDEDEMGIMLKLGVVQDWRAS